MIPQELSSNPMFGLTLTVAAYAISLALHRRVHWLHPLLVTCASLMALLVLLRIPVPDYQVGGSMLSLMLGPATVALAVPVYKHAPALKHHALAIGATLLAGSLIGITTALGCALAFRASKLVVLSILSKSVTTPITMEIARSLGGIPELAAAVTVLSGLIGAVLGPRLLRWTRLMRPGSAGLGMGVAAHGIGTASILRISEMHGTFSALAMALNGILTAAILTPLAPVIRRMMGI